MKDIAKRSVKLFLAPMFAAVLVGGVALVVFPLGGVFIAYISAIFVISALVLVIVAVAVWDWFDVGDRSWRSLGAMVLVGVAASIVTIGVGLVMSASNVAETVAVKISNAAFDGVIGLILTLTSAGVLFIAARAAQARSEPRP